jgi:hypothetical protein
LRYITNRYQTPCKAWAFHQERNYYWWAVHWRTMEAQANGARSDNVSFNVTVTHARHAVETAIRSITYCHA